MQTSFFFFFFSLHCFFKIQKKQKNRMCDPKVLIMAGSGMKDIQALIPNVGNAEASSAEEITQHSVWEEESAYGRCEAT